MFSINYNPIIYLFFLNIFIYSTLVWFMCFFVVNIVYLLYVILKIFYQTKYDIFSGVLCKGGAVLATYPVILKFTVVDIELILMGISIK